MGGNIVFISGANRGIGFSLMKRFVAQGDTVIAGYRTEERSKELLGSASDKLLPFKVEVTDEGDLVKLRDYIDNKFGKLDLLLNNAGIMLAKTTPLNELTPDELMESFKVNAVGPFLVTRTLYPLLLKGDLKRVVNITSKAGSITYNVGYVVAYRMSKSAANMLTSCQAITYKDDGISVTGIEPGWVRTELGGPKGYMEVEEATAQLFPVINGLTPEDTNCFYDYDGSKLEW